LKEYIVGNTLKVIKSRLKVNEGHVFQIVIIKPGEEGVNNFRLNQGEGK
jgi:hypothetical protein